MVNSGLSGNCFVCNLPILSHQVGLVWQGGNGVDDLLRNQMEMDIVRGRLGLNGANGRRDSSAQITTIETSGDMDYSSSSGAAMAAAAVAVGGVNVAIGATTGSNRGGEGGKRRRSSIAHLTELLKDWGIRDKDKMRSNTIDKTSGEGPRRGTLADLGRSFAVGKPARKTEADFMSKIRKRRETSADITVLRKGSATVSDLKNDISKFVATHNRRGTSDTSISSVVADESASSSRRGSEEDYAKARGSGALRIFKRKESRGNLSPLSPECDQSSSFVLPAAATAAAATSTKPEPPTIAVTSTNISGTKPAESSIPRRHSTSTSEAATSPNLPGSKQESRRDSLKPGNTPDNQVSNPSQQLSPAPCRRSGLRRQATACDDSAPTTKSGSTSRRGSRPFLSPEVSQDVGEGLGSARGRSGRRDSLSPDSATDECPKWKARRDSRPMLSPEPPEAHSRDGSPRRCSGRGGTTRRRSSGMSDDSEKRFGKAKPSPESSSPHSSSREHSPKGGSSGGGPAPSGSSSGNRNQMRRQSTTEEILIARGFRRESTTEDIMRCRNFRRQSAQFEQMNQRRGRRDSCTQITDGQVQTMITETETAFCDSFAQTESPSLYENNHYHEECLKCNSCGMNLSGPNQKRARRYKNQILCDLHFADMALMESSDFMQQLRNFKPQSLGCAVARRKSSTTLIFPLPPQACSDEFCDGYPHNMLPTPGYWVECSRAISNQGSAWTNDERDLHEIDEGITDSPDESISRDASVITDLGSSESSMPRIREPRRKKTPVEEHWEKYGSFGLTSVEQETHEKYFYGTEHWNYFTNDEDLGPVILSLKQENINGRDQFRVLVRAVSYTIHGLIPASCVFADRYNREEVVASLGREINLNPPLTLGQLPDTSEELLKLDQVFIKSELKVGVIYVREGQYSEEEILSNNKESEHFTEFLSILGEKVRLKGFDRYKGGLDTVHDLTGTQSIFTHWRGIEIMFHVSTMLPFEVNDPQKLQRKRHIGNDIVCVVFLEADNTSFSPACIKSHFLHTFIVVRTSPKIRFSPTRYELSVVTRDEVGAYKPYLWEQSQFTKGPMFREWMLTKIVNGERASYSAPKFARMQERTRSQMLEDLVANLQNHAETGQIPKPYRRGSWRPIGHMRPSSPLLDSVRDNFESREQLAEDFTRAFSNSTKPESDLVVGGASSGVDGTKPPSTHLFDVSFNVGQGKNKTKLYGVRAILGVRSRVFQEMLYGISTGFGSPQVPVAEILARAAPSPPTLVSKPKSSNFLQVPDIEGPRPKSVPNSPSVQRAFSNLRHQLTSAWSSHSSKKKAEQSQLSSEDKKKWPSAHDCSGQHEGSSGSGGGGSGLSRLLSVGSHKGGRDVPSLSVPKLSVCADSHKVDRSKLAQTEFPIIEFDGETFRVLLGYLHTGSCPLSCLNIPGLICAAEHYDLPELLQACFHHAKQFIRVDVACQMLNALENYYWRYCSASELVNMILAFIETRARAIFDSPQFLELSESMVQLIMNRNLEVKEIHKFSAMLKWAKHRIKSKTYSNKVDAKVEFRCCMDRLTRDLKLYRIPPTDLIKIVLPSKAIRNEKIMDTLMLQANLGTFREREIDRKYLDALENYKKKKPESADAWGTSTEGSSGVLQLTNTTVISYPAQPLKQSSLDQEDVQGAAGCSSDSFQETIKIQKQMLQHQHEQQQMILEKLLHTEQQYQHQQQLLERLLHEDEHNYLEREASHLRERSSTERTDSQDSDFRILAPLVIGEDLFMEEGDNDNESEWSLDIK